MFSARLPASLAPNRIAVALDAARASGRELLDLTESNPTVVGLDYPADEIAAALADPRALVYAPTPRGLDDARAAVAEYYARHGRTVDPAHVWLTASTSEAYSHLFKLLCNPGERVLVPRPSYPLFDLLARLESVELGHYPVRYHGGWFLDAEEVRSAIDARTRAVLVVNPNNPTGSFLKRREAGALERLCEERGLALICDEVFADYGRVDEAHGGERVTTLVDRTRALTFSLSGLSKPVGLPQLKLGWIHVAGPAALVAEAEARLEVILDSFLSVAAPVQHAARRLLALTENIGRQIAARVHSNRARVAASVRGTALQLLDAEGGWYAVLRVPNTRSEEEWVLALLDDGVIVQPGFFFDFEREAYLIVSLLVAPEVLDAGLSRIRKRVEEG
ncbi:MAG TPA: pyridoxal phosphate-dependent aminotransferase [Polyangia bacterium]|nr:pyridoxal phosphate-dependent aminotransferase [Polyangia bacterium]